MTIGKSIRDSALTLEDITLPSAEALGDDAAMGDEEYHQQALRLAREFHTTYQQLRNLPSPLDAFKESSRTFKLTLAANDLIMAYSSLNQVLSAYQDLLIAFGVPSEAFEILWEQHTTGEGDLTYPLADKHKPGLILWIDTLDRLLKLSCDFGIITGKSLHDIVDSIDDISRAQDSTKH